MKKYLLIGTIVLVLVASIIFVIKRFWIKNQILDGPGSYVEYLSGEVVEVKNVTSKNYVIVVKLDEDSTKDLIVKMAEVTVQFDNNHTKEQMLTVGSLVAVRFAGGVYSGDPLIITNTYGVELWEK